MRFFVLMVFVCMAASPAWGASMSVKASDLHILKGETVEFTLAYMADQIRPGVDESLLPDHLTITLNIQLSHHHVHSQEFPIEPGKTIELKYSYTFEEAGYHEAEATFKWTFIDEDGRETSDKKTMKPVTIGVANWVFTAGGTLGCIESSPLLSLDKTTLYIGSEDHNLYALDLADGTEKWRFAARGPINSTPALDQEGNLYFGCEDGYVYCLNNSGEMLWKYQTNGPVYSSPALDDDLQQLYIGSTDTFLYAIDLTGHLVWSFKTGGKITSSPVIGSDNTIYIGSLDHYLYAVTPQGVPREEVSPSEKWPFDAKSEIVGSPALDKDGTIFFGTAAFGGGTSDRNGLFAVSSSGNQKWFIQHYSGFLSAPVIGSDGTVCIGSYSNTLYGVDRKGGSLSMYKNFSDDHGASVALANDDYFFCGSKDGIVYGLDLMKGNAYKGRDVLWKYDVGEQITSSSPTINNGYIYVGTCGYDHGSVYSLSAAEKVPNEGENGLKIRKDSPWPLFRGNSRNTGKTMYTRETVAPAVVSVDPPDGKTSLDLTRRKITVTFSRPMDPESIYKQGGTSGNGYYGLTLEPFDSDPKYFGLNWNENHTECELELPELPESPSKESFKPYITYTASLLSKAKAADMPNTTSNNAILYNYNWSFSAMDEEEDKYEHGSSSPCFISQLLEKGTHGEGH